MPWIQQSDGSLTFENPPGTILGRAWSNQDGSGFRLAVQGVPAARDQLTGAPATAVLWKGYPLSDAVAYPTFVKHLVAAETVITTVRANAGL